ncbi:MAG: hypothetical protein ACE5G2_03410 [Candidatus Krumholzibacteriia bacterium]
MYRRRSRSQSKFPPRVRIPWSVVRLLLLVSVMLPAWSSAADLQGNIIHDGSGSGLYFVYAFRIGIQDVIAGVDARPQPGAYEIPDVTDDTYLLFAWRDLNGNMVPSIGEPLGWFGDPWPSFVTVQGRDVTGLDITLFTPAVTSEIQGDVTYGGTLSGRIWIVPHLSPTFDLFAIAGTPWTLSGPGGPYHCFVFMNGSYYLTAFMDRNWNLMPDEGEPIGTTPAAVQVSLGTTVAGIDIQLQDPFVSVEQTTWSEIKQLYSRP